MVVNYYGSASNEEQKPSPDPEGQKVFDTLTHLHVSPLDVGCSEREAAITTPIFDANPRRSYDTGLELFATRGTTVDHPSDVHAAHASNAASPRASNGRNEACNDWGAGEVSNEVGRAKSDSAMFLTLHQTPVHTRSRSLCSEHFARGLCSVFRAPT
jgi:hypothetical protein